MNADSRLDRALIAIAAMVDHLDNWQETGRIASVEQSKKLCDDLKAILEENKDILEKPTVS